MENEFIRKNLAEKINTILNVTIPQEIPSYDEIGNNCARLYYEGSTYDAAKMQTRYNFRFCYYAEIRSHAAEKASALEEYLKTAVPEPFYYNGSNFCIRYYNIISDTLSRANASGIFYFCAEVTFSAVL